MLHKNQFFTKFVVMFVVVSLTVAANSMSVSAFEGADDTITEDVRPISSYPVPKPVTPSGMKGYHMENFSGSNNSS